MDLLQTLPSAEDLAELAFRLSRGDRSVLTSILAPDAQSSTEHEDGTWSAVGPSGIRCGFMLGGDPVTQAVQLGFFYVGPSWPRTLPQLLVHVNTRWTAYQASLAARESGEQTSLFELGHHAS